MDELKARGVDDVYIEYYNTGKHELAQVYLKSEADKVIDLWRQRSHDHYERWFNLNKQYEGWFHKVMRCERAERETRHQKYKRCLAMAKWCRTSARCDKGLCAFKHRDWYWKWFKRWLALADKFKDETPEVSRCRPQELSEAK